VHVVPLSDGVIDLLHELPRLDRGDYLFSFTFGARPANSFGRTKIRLDALMPPGEPFVFHDIRRTVRTRLSGIPNVSDLVRELGIGHTKPGLHKVYDLHAYEDEKRQKRGLIYRTGSFAKGTQEAHRSPAAQQIFAKQPATYKGQRLLSAPRTDPGGRC
jgi:integrase